MLGDDLCLLRKYVDVLIKNFYFQRNPIHEIFDVTYIRECGYFIFRKSDASFMIHIDDVITVSFLNL